MIYKTMGFKSFYFLVESKQDIVNLHYPEIVAKLFYERFGNLSFLMARWFRDYKYDNIEKPENWWLQTMSSLQNSSSLWDLTYLYTATKNEESYRAALDRLDIHKDEFVDLEEERVILEDRIKKMLFSDGFFEYNILIKDILSGELKDISPYKKLEFGIAKDKYDKQRIFKDRAALRIYENGYKWIDTGMRCQLVGKLMKNCGSAGVMSRDENRTLLTLFDSRNKPHVVVTYSPKEKRISSDEGIGSSEVKNKYHDYILDLAKFLGVRFDVDRTRSTYLKVKYLLSGVADRLEELPGGERNDTYFRFSMNNQEYYTNGTLVVSDIDMKRANLMVSRGEIELRNDQNNVVKNTFNHMNQPILARNGVVYIPIVKFSNEKHNPI